MPRSLTLPAWVAVGSLAGIVAGIVFGERASVLIPIGSAYAMMLQIAIYPYLICSLLLGLGRLSPDMSRRFLGATWPAHLLVWVLTFGVIWFLAHAIPLPPSPARFSYRSSVSVFVTCVIPLIYFGKTTRFKVTRCAGARALAALVITATIAGGIWFRPTFFPSPSETVLRYTLAPALSKDLQVTIHPADSKDSVTTQADSSLKSISAKGVLRVGYNPHVIPFCYFNANSELVGFDVSYAYQLARSLNVNLELIPYEWESLTSDLQAGKFDFAISGIYITPERLQTVGVSRAYFESPIALIVKSNRANLFLKGESIGAMPDLKLAAFEGPALLPLVHQLFPKASVKIVPNYASLPELGDEVDGAVWTLEQASAWAAAHPGYTAVQPSELGAPIPFAFLFHPVRQISAITLTNG